MVGSANEFGLTAKDLGIELPKQPTVEKILSQPPSGEGKASEAPVARVGEAPLVVSPAVTTERPTIDETSAIEISLEGAPAGDVLPTITDSVSAAVSESMETTEAPPKRLKDGVEGAKQCYKEASEKIVGEYSTMEELKETPGLADLVNDVKSYKGKEEGSVGDGKAIVATLKILRMLPDNEGAKKLLEEITPYIGVQIEGRTISLEEWESKTPEEKAGLEEKAIHGFKRSEKPVDSTETALIDHASKLKGKEKRVAESLLNRYQLANTLFKEKIKPLELQKALKDIRAAKIPGIDEKNLDIEISSLDKGVEDAIKFIRDKFNGPHSLKQYEIDDIMSDFENGRIGNIIDKGYLKRIPGFEDEIFTERIGGNEDKILELMGKDADVEHLREKIKTGELSIAALIALMLFVSMTAAVLALQKGGNG